MTNTDAFEEETARIPLASMKELVFGAPRPKRIRLPHRLIFLAAFLGASVGCATSRPVTAEPETVGQLSASYNSIATAPVHKSTDLTPSFGAIDTDDAPVSVNSSSSSNGSVEGPAVVAKGGGISMGGAR